MLKRLGLLPLAFLALTVAVQQLSAQSLTTQFTGASAQGGCMYDAVAAASTVYVTGFDCNINSTGSETWELYYKAGTYVGSETTAANWTMLDSGTVTGQGIGNATNITLSVPLVVPAGQTVGVYLTVQSTAMVYTNSGATGSVNDANLTLNFGAGIVYSFAGVFSPRIWDGTLYYTLTNPMGDPEINCQHSATNAPNGSTVDVGVHTVATPFVEQFTIQNQGTTNPLTISSISCAPSGVGNCTVTPSPTLTPASPIPASSSATFDVSITVTAEGPFEFTITIANNDTTGGENPYVIIVQGTGGMSGTYLVSNDAGETPDFVDLGAAFDALETNGVSGPVTIEVSEGTGPYTSTATYSLGDDGSGSYTLKPVLGLSITSGLTITNQAGERPVITGSGVPDPFGLGSGTLLFVETAFVTVQGLECMQGSEFGIGMFDNTGGAGIVRNWTVRNCIVHGTNGNGIWCFSNLGMGVDWVTIENNFIYDVQIGDSFYYDINPGSFPATGLGLGAIAFGPLGTNTVVRHNTIVINSGQGSTTPASNHGAISVGLDSGGGVTGAGPSFQELSYNIIVNLSTGIVPLDMPQTAIPATANYNVYYNTASAFVRINTSAGGAPEDLTAWQFSSSNEAQTVITNPNLANTTVGNEDLHLTAGSTNAIDMAVGSTTVADDIDEDSRPSGATADIGADEYTGGGSTGTVTVAATTTPAAEPSTNGAWTITFSTATTATTDVSFTLTGAATLTADYTISASVGTASATGVTGIPAATTTVVVTLTVVDDGNVEGNEDAILTLTGATQGYTVGTPAAATVVINDDDASPTNPAVSVSSSGSPSETGPTPGTFTITASPAPSSPVQVNVAFSGTAVNGTDYTVTGVTGGQVTIPVTGSVTVTITPIDDTASEGGESVTLTISAGAGYTVGTQAAATLTIADNDGTPPPPITGGGGGGGGGGGCAATDGSSYWMLALGLLAVLGLGLRMRARRE